MRWQNNCRHGGLTSSQSASSQLAAAAALATACAVCRSATRIARTRAGPLTGGTPIILHGLRFKESPMINVRWADEAYCVRPAAAKDVRGDN